MQGMRLLTAKQLFVWQGLNEMVRTIADGIEAGAKIASPFTVIGALDMPSLHRRAAEVWVSRSRPAVALQPPQRRPLGERIHIGYYSADFHDHATAHLAAGLFECHDRRRFRITAFSFGPDSHKSYARAVGQRL